VTAWQRLHWVGLAFVPSSLMLGATTYITTDVAAIPLLWVLPLGLYLLSFILVFGRPPAWVHQVVVLVLPVLVLLVLFLILSGIGKLNVILGILLHGSVLFVAAMCCHGELALRRPAAEHLTEFYLLLSVGGVLGGLFNALLAPLAFNDLYEYPVALILACLLLPRLAWLNPAPAESDRGKAGRRFALVLDFLFPLAVGLLSLGLILTVPDTWTMTRWLDRLAPGLVRVSGGGAGVLAAQVRPVLIHGLPAVLCYLFVDRPLRFGLGVAAFWLAALVPGSWDRSVVHQERSFFGVLKVINEHGYTAYLMHGTTIHGAQQVRLTATERLVMAGAGVCPLAAGQPLEAVTLLAAAGDGGRDPRQDPLTYYHRDGPIGRVMAAFPDPRRNLAVIGLGAGSMAAYAAPGQRLTFYEIDGAVVRLSEGGPDHKPYFTFLKEAKQRGVDLRVLLGDARLVLERTELAADEKYHLLVVDAFSSDAVPTHLITRQALRLYLGRLAPGGIVAFHTSNRYLDLAPVLGNLAEAEQLASLVMEDTIPQPGKFASTWVLLARDGQDFRGLRPVAEDPDPGEGSRQSGVWYRDVRRRPSAGVWSDDFSNVLGVFRPQG
jgi:hypothetical protein